MQHNSQTPEKRVRSEGRELSVHSVFHTIQGEGPFCGTPAVFIRLAGCNLQCPLCDTDYTSGRRMVAVWDIYQEVKRAHGRNLCQLVVITGGEPFRQNIEPLFDILLSMGYFVQVETNGTLGPPVNTHYNRNTGARKGVYIVCSPKAGKVHADIHRLACCYKYVGGLHLDPMDGLPMHPLEHPSLNGVPRPIGDKPVYLQPTDFQDEAMNAQSLSAVKASCMEFGHILQLQIHKLIGVA